MLTETKTIMGGGSFVTAWDHNSADLPKWIRYPDNETVTYKYNSRMLLETLSGSANYVTGTTYDAAGRIDLRTFGSGAQTDYQYFPWNQQGGRLQYLKSGLPGDLTSLQSLEYAYDPAGNVDWIKDWKAGDLSGPQRQDFGYDTLDRLTNAQVTGGAEGLYSESYSYDPDTGNLQSKGGLNYTYSTAHPHAVSGFNGNTYGYDVNGNMTQRVIGLDTYDLAYDAENRLVEVKKNNLILASFMYDGDGRRVKQEINGEITSFVGNYYEKSSTTITKYYYAGSARIAMRSGTSLYYLLGDHLGSTSVTTDTGGVKLSELRYSAWGATRYSSGTTPTTYRYTGQREDSYINLLWYGSRHYDPELGRFIKPDSIVPLASQGVQAWDRYAYANNGPTRYTDPSGHAVECGVYAGTSCGGKGPTYKPPEPPQPPIKPTKPFITSHRPCVGQPVIPGDYKGAYCAGGGGFDSYVISSVYGDGECVNGICTLAGGSVPLKYHATHDVAIFDNLLVLTINESYWFPAYALPLLDDHTFGGSAVVAQLQSGKQEVIPLGDFVPGSIASTETMETRTVSINFWQQENFPTGIKIQLIFGAESIGARTAYYLFNNSFWLPY